MKNTYTLSDDVLLERTQKIVRLERKITVRLIEHLKEVDRRKLHLKRGFNSLHDYLIRGLGYSGGAAHRRVQAMEACRDVPGLTQKIESGQVNLTQAMQVQGQFEREEKHLGKALSVEEKSGLMAQVEGLSTRETEKLLAARMPEAPRPDKKKAISGKHTQITFTADEELMQMIERVKDLVAHQNPHPNFLELFKLMAKKTLERLDPMERAKRARKRRTPSDSPAPGSAPVPASKPSEDRRMPDAATLYALYERDQGKCQYVDSKTGRKCGSTRAIEPEHIIPYAMGGKTELDHLELLCQAHNKLRAVEVYGEAKMGEYMPGFCTTTEF